MKSIELSEFGILLDGRKAIIHQNSSTLILSDLHIGKQAHFRKNGLALPNYQKRNEIDRIEALISDYQIERIIYAGDLFHSQTNQETIEFLQWVNSRKLEQILVKGNHDQVKKLQEGLQISDYYLIEQGINTIKIVHDPKDIGGHTGIIIHGHIHPGIMLGKGKLKLSIPCFYQKGLTFCLPAFGSTTGLYRINQKEADRIWGINTESSEIIPIKKG